MKKRLVPIFSFLIPAIILAFLLFGLAQQAAQAATFTVTKTADSNDGTCNADCSLREAVTTTDHGDIVRFDSSLAGMTFTVNTTIGIDKNIIIDGSTLSQRPVIQMIGAQTIFTATSTATLNALILKDGQATVGGAIHNNGNLTINNSDFTNNQAAQGGAIFNEGRLAIYNSTFSNNQADFGGAIHNKLAISSASPLDTYTRISESVFAQNSAVHGGAIFNEFDIDYTAPPSPEATNSIQNIAGASTLGYVEILGSRIANNSASQNGGGITTFVWQEEIAPTESVQDVTGAGGIPVHGVVYIAQSEIAENTAVSYGGGIHNTVITPTLSTPTESPAGIPTYGGIAAVLIERTTIDGNSAEFGGGISNKTAPIPGPQAATALPSENIFVNISQSLIQNNLADAGGGFYMGTDILPPAETTQPTAVSGTGIPDVVISQSTFAHNSAATGGGIEIRSGHLVAVNSTFSGNIGSFGAAVYNASNSELWHTTTYTNTVELASTAIQGIATHGSIYNSGNLTLVNSIIGGTNGPANEDCVNNGGNVTNTSNIILDGTSCGVAAITIDPMLEPLGYYSGYTPVHHLGPGSSAVDVADAAGCGYYLVNNRDQRGILRPPPDGDKGSTCDIGAVEYAVLPTYLPLILKQ